MAMSKSTKTKCKLGQLYTKTMTGDRMGVAGIKLSSALTNKTIKN